MERAYIAGFFDGEGHVAVRLQRGYAELHVHIAQNDRRVLDLIAAEYGGKVYGRTGLPGHRLCMYGLPAARFIRLIFPWLVVKRMDAYFAVVDYYNNRKWRRCWPPKYTANMRHKGNRRADYNKKEQAR